MPTLSMYKLPAVSQAAHLVFSPGGYEAWRIDAISPASDVQVVAALMAGCPYYPPYLRQYARFLRQPTRLKPPLPGDFPAIQLSVYRGGTVLYEHLALFPGGSLESMQNQLDFRLGLSRLWEDPAGMRFSIRGKYGRAGVIAAELLLPGCHPGELYDLRIFNGGEVEHHWSPIAAPCPITGEVSIKEARGAAPIVLKVEGQASVDHEYGTAPVGGHFDYWMRGVAFFPDRAILFRLARPAGGSAPDDVISLVDADGIATPLPPTTPRVTQGFSDDFPTVIDAAPYLRLDAPRVIDSGRPYTRLTYTARSQSRTGQAIVEVLRPAQIKGRRLAAQFHRIRKMET